MGGRCLGCSCPLPSSHVAHSLEVSQPPPLSALPPGRSLRTPSLPLPEQTNAGEREGLGFRGRQERGRALSRNGAGPRSRNRVLRDGEDADAARVSERRGEMSLAMAGLEVQGGSGGAVRAKRGAREEQTYPAPKRLPKEEEDTETDLDFEEVSEEEVQAFLELELQSDSGIPATRHYECVFLIHEDNYEDVPEIIQKVKDKITEFKGTVWRLNDWGLRRMAYKIKKASKANYILLNFEILPAQMGEFEKMLLSDERIIRHLVMKKKGPETKDYPPPPEWGEKVDSEDEYDWSEDEEEEEEDGPEWAYEGEEGDEDDDEEWEEGKESGGTQEDGGVKAKAKDSKDTVPKKNSVASKTRR